MHSLLVESATWFPLVVLILILRYISRWLQLGSVKNYQLQDFVMLVVFLFYTTLMVSINIVFTLDTNLILPADIPQLTPESIASRVKGSKLVLVVEQSMIMTIWGGKACLLLMYMQMMQGIKPHNFIVKLVAIYVGTGLVVMEVLYFGVWCRPFSNYWAVPTPNAQCSTALNHLIVNATFNISSDLMMLFVPMPMVIKAQLPTMKKGLLISVFSLGIFAIISASANKYYSFVHPFGVMWTYWYIREASTVMFVTNIPMCWPLARKLFGWRSWSGTSDGTKSKSRAAPKRYFTNATSSRFGNKRDNSMYRSESRDVIIHRSTQDGSAIGLEIWESREVSVKTEPKNFREERIKNTTAVTVNGSRGSSSEQEQGRCLSRIESRQDIGHAV
ncbi:uncharacterized protein EAF01_009963 [Botrytis porri]|uniref:Rhodopsin domain-containing protein n=1 Tax=Botrytis porri TaxID=87229 RepID=A0A4Z1KI65_9HELO|nr:uncharacterized protein EAF01_009963 [Botrytis porri]KAF7894512.1 hypothetical protein EAF01_009963 [Botrytis porri]TGO85210.1 hypothetical protein BPOR_0419g00010 [Botrytis porri]